MIDIIGKNLYDTEWFLVKFIFFFSFLKKKQIYQQKKRMPNINYLTHMQPIQFYLKK